MEHTPQRTWIALQLVNRLVVLCWCRKPVKEFLDAINALKTSDISALVTKLLKTPLSLASLGDIASVPRYNAVQKRFA